jgi:hypothetical protein
MDRAIVDIFRQNHISKLMAFLIKMIAIVLREDYQVTMTVRSEESLGMVRINSTKRGKEGIPPGNRPTETRTT